jgi:hypothetical protein
MLTGVRIHLFKWLTLIDKLFKGRGICHCCQTFTPICNLHIVNCSITDVSSSSNCLYNNLCREYIYITYFLFYVNIFNIVASSKTRWNNLLMWSLLICFSCKASVMKMLELQQGNASVSIQIRGNRTDMCLQWYTAVRRKQCIHATQHTLAMADTMCRMKRKC